MVRALILIDCQCCRAEARVGRPAVDWVVESDLATTRQEHGLGAVPHCAGTQGAARLVALVVNSRRRSPAPTRYPMARIVKSSNGGRQY
jgi:hypothetical protein